MKDVKTGSFKGRDLMNVNPLSEQFEPTDAQPVRQHVRMAGGDAVGQAVKVDNAYKSKRPARRK